MIPDYPCLLLRAKRLSLVSFLFFLPLLEAPKNISGVLYVMFTFLLATRYSNRFNFYLFKSGFVDKVLLLIILSAILAGIDGYFSIETFRSNINWALMPLVAYCVIRDSSIDSLPELKNCMKWIFFGAGFSYIDMLFTSDFIRGGFPELRSVGHVNQSALYISLIAVLSLASTQVYQNLNSRLYLAFLILASWMLLIAGRSMIAVTVAGCCSFLVAVYFFWIQSRLAKYILAFPFVIVVSIYFAVSLSDNYKIQVDEFYAEVAVKIQSGDTMMSGRQRLLESTLYSMDGIWLFGSGIGNYDTSVTTEKVRSELVNRNEEWGVNRARFQFQNHGHSLYITGLAERGIIGLAIIVILFCLIIFYFYRMFGRTTNIWLVLVYCAGVYAFLGGVGNTTLHNEHGQLAFLIIAFSACAVRYCYSNERCLRRVSDVGSAD